MIGDIRMMDSFIHRVELRTTLLLRSAYTLYLMMILSFVLCFESVYNLSLIFVLFRSSMIEAMMEQQRTCGHAVLYSMFCLQVTYLLMILI